jgi:4-diphosphocytidyl-2-C-methyl-D-erythritol kinase
MWYFYIKYFEMVIFPKAKINIGLRITGKRDDGYHDLQTIFYPVPLCDALEFVVKGDQIESDIFATTGLSINCDTGNNLIMKALQKLRLKYTIPFLSIHLHKNISMGAGLGGGSSDAAFFLKGLNRYFGLEMTGEELKEISLTIGSDCPFFIDCVPSYAEGRGEKLSPVNPVPDGYYLLMVNPGISISTREAYSGCISYKSSTTPDELYKRDMTEWKDLIVNDFEKTVFKTHPVIGQIKDTLYKTGAVYSSMSGSGSTIYGIFRNKPGIPSGLRRMIIYSGTF